MSAVGGVRQELELRVRVWGFGAMHSFNMPPPSVQCNSIMMPRTAVPETLLGMDDNGCGDVKGGRGGNNVKKGEGVKM
jgi:hypothetical protein